MTVDTNTSPTGTSPGGTSPTRTTPNSTADLARPRADRPATTGAGFVVTSMENGEVILLENVRFYSEESLERTPEEQVKHFGEEAKVSIRSSRHKILDFIKKEQKNGLAEDIAKTKEQLIQNSVTDYSAKVDKIIELKEKEIMTV